MVAARRILVVVVTAGLLSAVFQNVASAEVMDKEASPAMIWGFALVPGVLGLLAWRFAPSVLAVFLGCLTAVVGVMLLCGVLSEIRDPYVGPAIIEEAGYGYVVQAWSALLALLLLETGGVLLYRRRASNNRFQRTPEAIR